MTPDEVPEELVQAALTAIRADGADDWGSEYDRIRIGLAAVLPLYDLRRLEADFKEAVSRWDGQYTILTHRWRIMGEYGPLPGEYTTEKAAFAELEQQPAGAYVQVRSIKEEPWMRAADSGTVLDGERN